eukprot:CAMPEP_0172327550 /NCGR_PEP_ID=MMETSP1058-20130122/59875_1 /TAXON_ID=83371 /ORGANISM="Detonula confervacea, Strain CCMP 353" /LENGTH=555 /DNA_ID=CAMNT_0013044629 /DNA_START=49 /DNA_END=1712 /DNA_ORIENTATION=-
MPLLVVAMLAVGIPSAGAFNTETSSFTVRNNVHPISIRASPPFRTSALFNSSPPKRTGRTDAEPRKRKAAKSIQPTARSVAISALADAAASSAEEGAQVTFATQSLDSSTQYSSLDPRDRAFARLLVATVERRLGQIDIVLGSVVKKYPPKKGKHSHAIQATLRTGVAQLLFLETPPHAAIKETVQVLRMKPPVPEPMIKFVNGVLRNLSRPPADETEDAAEILGKILLKEKTSSEDNIAPWLLNQWRNDWGDEKTKLICDEMMPSDESMVTPRIDLSTIYSLGAASGMPEDKDKVQSLMENLGEDSILLPQGSIRVGSSLKGDVKGWPEYDEGTWWVQDASSTLPALVLTRALNDKYSDDSSDIHVVDMCAAPGGKTSQLLSAGFGKVTAIEASPRRSQRLMENLKRLGLEEKCQVVVEEGQNWVPSSEVHGILVDVPCSATGTGARRPDVLRKGSNLEELLETQEMLANHCADNILDVGGVMIYATCSMLKEESEDQVQKLIERGNMETVPIQPREVPGFEDAIDDHGWLRVLPGILEGDLSATDGFFVAKLV